MCGIEDQEHKVCVQGRCRNGHGGQPAACECRPGWHGELCDQNEGNNQASVTCEDGKTLCYNDSTCVEHGDMFKCDCHTANAMHKDAHFVGPLCTFNVNGPHIGNGGSIADGFLNDPGFDAINNLPSFSSCHNKDNAHHGFEFAMCLNGGTCVEIIDADETEHPGCNCPSGYVGEHCEQPDVSHGAEETCSASDSNSSTKALKCYNGGQCNSYAFGSLTDKNSCVCPTGYIGSSCSTRMSLCGDNEHFCLNGGECVMKRGEYVCDCTNASSSVGFQVSGENCISTSAITSTTDNQGGNIDEGTFVGIILGGLFMIAAAGVGYVFYNHKMKRNASKNIVSGNDLVLEADGSSIAKVGDASTTDGVEGSDMLIVEEGTGPNVEDAELI